MTIWSKLKTINIQITSNSIHITRNYSKISSNNTQNYHTIQQSFNSQARQTGIVVFWHRAIARNHHLSRAERKDLVASQRTTWVFVTLSMIGWQPDHGSETSSLISWLFSGLMWGGEVIATHDWKQNHRATSLTNIEINVIIMIWRISECVKEWSKMPLWNSSKSS